MKKIILFVIFLCLFPIKAFASGYEEITGGVIKIKLHLVETDKHERSIFDSSHFVLDIQGEEDINYRRGTGSVFYSTPVTEELRNTGTTEISVDLNGLTFTEPNVYKYSIHGYFTSYKSLERDTVYHLTDNEFEYLYVYVVDNNGKLEIANYVIGDDGNKTFEYFGKLATNTLEVTKLIKGNQASVFQRFNVTISVKRAIPNMKYNLGQGYTLFTDNSGNGTITATLGHKQTLRITDLPIGCSYTVSEDAEDYVSSVVGKTNWLFRTPDQKMSVVFTNEKSGLIPTGIILNNGGIFIIIGISVLGILLIKRRKNES